MKKENMKGSKGITLVALIITIIVLLILAVVAISAVSGDGILRHAQNSTDQYNAAQIKENTILSNYLDYINKYNPNGGTVPQFTNVTNTYGTDWTYAWTCTNGAWEPMIDNSDGTKTDDDLGTYDVVAKFYKQQQVLENLPQLIINSALPPINIADGNAYKLAIEGNGNMGILFNGTTGDGWCENMINAIGKEIVDSNDFILPYVTEVLICDGVTNIGQYAFLGTLSLDSINISSTVESIDPYAFQVSNLQAITIPGSVTTIDYRAFDGCTSLASVIIQEGVTTIGDNAFSRLYFINKCNNTRKCNDDRRQCILRLYFISKCNNTRKCNDIG